MITMGRAFVIFAVANVFVGSFRYERLVSMRPKVNSLVNNGWRRLSTTMSEPVVEDSATKPAPSIKADFSSFVVGQEYDGTVMSAKNFGVFVDISTGFNVLIPRSLVSRNVFEKLKQMSADKSKDLIKVSLVGVSAENQTLTGKYIVAKGKERSELTALTGSDIKAKFFNATVISAHDFGLFAEIDELNVEGLVPASKLPDQISPADIKKKYPAGTKVIVQVSDVNVENKKLIMSMKFTNRPAVEAFSNVPQSKWFQSIVQSVSSFGLFVRPAGFDSIGLIHYSRVPRDLISALKKRVTIAPGTNKTDIELLFQEGDVVKSRIHGVDVSSRKLELSMLPMRNMEEEDDYIVPGRDPEGEEEKFMEQDKDEEEHFDAEETLLWWRGAPYEKLAADNTAAVEDEEVEVVNENIKVVEGTWRRMFEVDLREDENEFSSKVMEQELAELAEEIGELEGLDDDMTDSLGFGVPYSGSSLGLSVSRKILPAGWSEEMDFFKALDTTKSALNSGLKGGKKAEQLEFERLLKEVEMELEQSSYRGGSRQQQQQQAAESNPLVVDESSSAVEVEVAAPAAVEEAAPAAGDS